MENSSHPGNGRVPDLCVEVAIPADVEPEVFVIVVLVVRRRQDVQERSRAFAAGVELVEVVLVRLKLQMETIKVVTQTRSQHSC